MAKARSAIEQEFKWDIEKLYQSDAAWEADFQAFKSLSEKLAPFKGKLGDSAETLAAALKTSNDIDRRVEKLALYASMHNDQDMTDSVGPAQDAKATTLISQLASETAWMTPEIIAIDDAKMSSFMRSEHITPPLRRQLEIVLRAKKHVLTPAEESIMALAYDPLSVSTDAYEKLCNADFVFGDIEVDGKQVPLTSGTYIKYLTNPSRKVRYDAFKLYYKKYREHVNVITSLMNGQVKLRIMNAKVRHYASSLECSLDADNVSPTVYNSLIDAVHLSFPSFFKYVALRKRVLAERGQLAEVGGDEKSAGRLDMYDIYVPLVSDCDVAVTYEQAKEWVVEAVAPLGEEYVGLIKEALRDRWVDVYENKGKRSGAYSTSCYDCHPFVLLNFDGTIDSVFTLAHELGHSIHSYLSGKHQEYPINDYRIFVAEVASTTNEALLSAYLRKKFAGDKKMLTYLYNSKCDDFKGTVFRQTMFAEFEKMFHHFVETDQPLTPELMNRAYYDLNRAYYGPDVDADKDIELEWERIPHFYMNFYVYKYATSFCAAEYISKHILDEQTRPEMVKKYLHFLSSGQTKDPQELLKDVGVDMTKTEFITDSMKTFDESVDKLSELLQ